MEVSAEELRASIDRAFEKAKAALAREEASATGRPEKHPVPTKDECWQAFVNALVDAEVPVDDAAREGFERWWLGGSGTHT